MSKPWPPPRAAELDLDALDVLADGAMAGYLERRWFGVGVGDYRLMADIRAAGGYTAVVRSMRDALEAIQEAREVDRG